MKNPTIKIWPLLCAIFILNACQKETSTNKEEEVNTENSGIRASGALPDDPALVANVPLIVSSEFYNSPNDLVGARGGGSSRKDSDGDGIPNTSDNCPTQKETINGYLDTDGCPDTVPTPTPTDTDGDGIPDANDACPTQKETVNGYKDTDGCPDTVPDTDGDGIDDVKDACPTQKETVNGYLDTDGCPDTPPVVIPPTTLPSSFQLVMPPVGNQGAESSCIVFNTAYGARSCEQYYRTNATSYSYATNIFSPEYVYNQTKIGSDCGSGTAITLVLDLMKNKGVVPWATMPYSDANGCSLMPTAAQDITAASYKIGGYSKILKNDKNAIKTMLTQKHAVIASITIDNYFTNATAGFIWKTAGTGNIGHGLVICGYDDSRNAYRAMNSWGTAWGDAGYIWIDYDFFPTRAGSYVYVMNY